MGRARSRSVGPGPDDGACCFRLGRTSHVRLAAPHIHVRLDATRPAVRSRGWQPGARLLPPAEAERITGYHVGGISPFGQKKRAGYFIDVSALAHPTIIVNGGRRGLQIEIAPDALVKLLGATSADLCA